MSDDDVLLTVQGLCRQQQPPAGQTPGNKPHSLVGRQAPVADSLSRERFLARGNIQHREASGGHLYTPAATVAHARMKCALHSSRQY